MVAVRTHHHFIVRCRIKRLAELAKAQLQEANGWALVCGQEDNNVFHPHSEQVQSQGQGWHMIDRLSQRQEGQGCPSLAFHQC